MPITTRTAFDLASVTKVFTGASVMLLSERGRLRLSDPVARHLSGMGHAVGCRPITVQDLLWHTSDLPDYLAVAAQDESFELVPEAVLEGTREWVRRAEPGRRHEYSNTNYVLLAEVIGAAGGAPYGDFLRENLFEPFGLSDTFVLGGERGDCVVRARGYENVGFGAPNHQRSEMDLPILGDGGVFSSLRDLLRWQELYFGGRIVSPATLARALAPGRLDCGATFDYGCGLMTETLGDGRTWCGHTGAWSGAAAFLGRWVEERLSVVVLSNDQNGPVVRIAQRSLAAWRGRQSGSEVIT